MRHTHTKTIAPERWTFMTVALLVVAFLAATIMAGRVARRIDEMAGDITRNADPSIRSLASARTELHTIGALLTTAVLDRENAPSLQTAVSRADARLHGDLRAYTSFPSFPDEPERWHRASIEIAAFENSAHATLQRLEAGDVAGASALRAGSVGTSLDRADASLAALIAFNAEHAATLGAGIQRARHSAERDAWALDAAAVLLGAGMLTFAVRATRQYVGAQRSFAERLGVVADAAMDIAQAVGHSDPRHAVIQTTVDAARRLVGADMAALGVGTDDATEFDDFVFSGVDATLLVQLGRPRPTGIRAAVIAGGRAIRVDDVYSDPRFAGLPDGHPPVGPFLGVPVQREGRPVGHLWLGRSPGAVPFTEEDANAIELLCAFAATAFHNATLHVALQREVREDMLSIVSHDLRNPLSAITVATAHLRRSRDDPGDAARKLDVIARSTMRMTRLIDDLLTAAKVHEGKLVVETQPCDAGALVGECIEECSGSAASAGVHLHHTVAAGLPLVSCDGGRLQQVLVNLVSNAVKFTPRGGEVRVRVETDDAGMVLFSVADTGAGIPPGEREHLFDRYWQRREHATRGTGLGLFIAKNLVESMRGRIEVESEQGRGSTFRFTLPAAVV